MARQTSGDRLKAAIEAKAALDAEIKELQAAERKRQRDEDDRRFGLMGRTLCAHIAAEPEGQLARDVSALLDRTLTRASDRGLFAFLTTATAGGVAGPAKVKVKPRSSKAAATAA